MALMFRALATNEVRRLQAGGADANGIVPERQTSDGTGNPCRHCLSDIPAGKEMLVLAFRPFPDLQPFAEVGPIFLCAEACERHVEAGSLPVLFDDYDCILLRGYSSDDRIRYGSGRVIAIEQVEAEAQKMFADGSIAYIHMRSSTNNCYQCRIDRAFED